MDERTRIINLLQDGRITPDEATMLLDALAAAQAPAGQTSWGFQVPPVPPVSPVPPVPPMPPVTPIPQIARKIAEKLKSRFEGFEGLEEKIEEKLKSRFEGMEEEIRERLEGMWASPSSPRVTVSEPITTPSHLRWIHLELHSEDLNVVLDPSLEKPLIRGDVETKQTEDGIKVSTHHGPRNHRHRKGRGSKSFVGGITVSWDLDLDFDSDVEVRVPHGWGIHAQLHSGDLEVEGIPFVRGEVVSGDAELRGVQGVDLSIISGELEAELMLTEGEHRLEVMSGDVEIRFVNSSVKVEGKLANGDLDARGNFEQHKRKISGVVGQGDAKLRINVMSGDLVLEDTHNWPDAEGEPEDSDE